MKDKDLHQKLFDEAYRFEFFQAVRLLKRIFPERSEVGGDSLPLKEVVRFRSRPVLDFPASEVYQISEVTEVYTDERKIEMFVNFIGMLGNNGVLPHPYTELVAERVRVGDSTLYFFLDIFTHRATSLFFKAWEKYRLPIRYENGNQELTNYFFDFLGLGTKGLRGKSNLEEESLIPYSGLISQKPHSVSGLEQILSDYFQVTAKIEQFFGQWLELDEESVSKIAKQNNQLGFSTVLGSRVWDNQSKIRIVFEALSYREFQAFLPNGTAYRPALGIIRLWVGLEFDFDIKLKLKAQEVPSTVLTTRAKRRPMLGWNTFLKTQPFVEDDEQVVLQTAEKF